MTTESMATGTDSPAAAERRLVRMTAHLREWSGSIPELRDATGGPSAIERIIARAEHVFLPFAGGPLHLETTSRLLLRRR